MVIILPLKEKRVNTNGLKKRRGDTLQRTAPLLVHGITAFRKELV
jgi:hypothetical protein